MGMLVLSRQRAEVITIGDDVEVHVVDIRGDKVRLGIHAPRQVPVHRKEVADAIRRQQNHIVESNVTATPGGGGQQPPA